MVKAKKHKKSIKNIKKSNTKSKKIRRVHKPELILDDRQRLNVEIAPRKRNFFSIFFAILILGIVLSLAIGIQIKTQVYVITEPVSGEHRVVQKIPYKTTKTYSIIEEYQKKVPYGTKDCKQRGMDFNVDFDSAMIQGDTILCGLTVENLENASGAWTYNSYVESPVKNLFSSELEKTIAPLSSEKFRWEFKYNQPLEKFACKYSQIKIPSMTKCFYADPITYKIVTKTRTVEKNKTVIKYKEVGILTNNTAYKNVTKRLTVIKLFNKDVFQFG